MSRCPSDGPVLKSILGLYRPAADCLLSLSLSCCFNGLSLSICTNLFFFFFPSHTHCHLSSPSLPPSALSSVDLFAPSHSPSPPLPPLSLSLTLLSLAPSSHLSSLFYSASHHVITQIALSALWWETLRVSPSLSFFSLSLCPISYCLTLSWCFSSRQLMENKISTIERGAFQDLKELERLWVTFCNRGGRHFMP